MFACLELSFKIIYKTASCCMFLFLLKNLYPYPRIGVFLERAYPRIRYVSYPIHVPISVHPRGKLSLGLGFCFKDAPGCNPLIYTP